VKRRDNLQKLVPTTLVVRGSQATRTSGASIPRSNAFGETSLKYNALETTRLVSSGALTGGVLLRMPVRRPGTRHGYAAVFLTSSLLLAPSVFSQLLTPKRQIAESGNALTLPPIPADLYKSTPGVFLHFPMRLQFSIKCLSFSYAALPEHLKFHFPEKCPV
jgi:hypothetical protein